MRRGRETLLGNRVVAVIVLIFSVIGAMLLHENPFGEGTISWPIAFVVALAGNMVLAYIATPWAAPYLASTGGREGAAAADPQSVRVAERWMAGTLMLFGIFSLLAVGFAASDIVITPTERLERNAELVRRTVEAQAPAKYVPMLPAADTWKMSERTLRTCVPPPGDKGASYCVVVRSEGDNVTLVKSGVALSNAEQALEWHPELAEQGR